MAPPSTATVSVSQATAKSLPVIDLSHFGEGNAARDGAVAHALRDACEDKGFFYVVGHGVEPDLIAALRQQAEAFFSKPLEQKEAVSKDLVRLQSWL
jgi:isopenicillin N synthase-like dioxygenase